MDFPYQIIRVPGSDAIAKLMELRAARSGTPIILGDQESFERTCEGMEDESGSTVKQLIDASLKLDPLKWLKDQAEEDADDDESGSFEVPHGDWPDDDGTESELSAHCDPVTQEPYREVVLTVLPTVEAWTAPCFLRFGNWNSVPPPEVHAALFKTWSERYGATVACIASDVVEFTVARPPKTRTEAMELAEQQYIYCTDIVDQGVGTVEALAAALLNGPTWYFWWD